MASSPYVDIIRTIIIVSIVVMGDTHLHDIPSTQCSYINCP